MTLFLPLHLGAVVMAGWFSHLWTSGTTLDMPSEENLGSSGLVGLTSLVLVVPMLIVISYLVQPVLISRYAITAVAAIAPAVAFITARMRRSWIILLIGFFVVGGAFELHQRTVRARDYNAQTRELIQSIREHTGNNPVLFETPHQLYVVWHYASDLRNRVFLLDFETEQFANNVSRFRILTRDVSRQVVRFYGSPSLMAWEQVSHANTVYIVPDQLAYSRMPLPHERYPKFIMFPMRGRLHQLVRAREG
jgi:hypothetical protein